MGSSSSASKLVIIVAVLVPFVVIFSALVAACTILKRKMDTRDASNLRNFELDENFDDGGKNLRKKYICGCFIPRGMMHVYWSSSVSIEECKFSMYERIASHPWICQTVEVHVFNTQLRKKSEIAS